MNYFKLPLDEKTIGRILYFIFFLVLLYFLCFFSRSEITRLISLIPDDSSYFFEIAENAAGGNGLSCDGIHITNGFQPLWLYILIPIFLIYSGPPEIILRIILILQVSLLFLSSLIIYSTHSDFFSRKIAFFNGIIFIIIVFVPALNGMESALLIFMLTALLAYSWKRRVFTANIPRREIIFGLLLGLLMLTRLDAVFIGVSISVFCVARSFKDAGNRSQHIRRLILIITGASLIVLPYLIYNHIAFGSLVPISGALKSSFPHSTLSCYGFLKMGKKYWLFTLYAIIYFISYLLKHARKSPLQSNQDYFHLAMSVLAFSVILHALFTILFLKWAIFNWHFIYYAFFAALALNSLIAFLSSKFQTKKYSLLLGLLFLSGTLIAVNKNYNRFHASIDRNWQVASYEAAIWARHNTDKNAIFAMKDSGHFGFFSERKVINLDGIVNNSSYQETIKNKQLNLYLKENGVKYLVQHAFWNNEAVNSGRYGSYTEKYYSHKYDIESDGIILDRTNEVYRSKPYHDGPYRTVFIIWTFFPHLAENGMFD
ncbi:MAG: hypothetical protein JXB45_06940 [Candidatus Krumholzibacteriota bacterium]|nr:hypothetical protein [Candidatus Krumholzibacteriota bacterium]